MDAEAASSAAMDTVLHATRAANWGSQDANHALSSLTLSGVESMTPDAQSSLLLDVLQQVGDSGWKATPADILHVAVGCEHRASDWRRHAAQSRIGRSGYLDLSDCRPTKQVCRVIAIVSSLRWPTQFCPYRFAVCAGSSSR